MYASTRTYTIVHIKLPDFCILSVENLITCWKKCYFDSFLINMFEMRVYEIKNQHTSTMQHTSTCKRQ